MKTKMPIAVDIPKENKKIDRVPLFKSFILVVLVLIIVAIYVISFKNRTNESSLTEKIVAAPSPIVLTQREKDVNYFYAVKIFNDGDYETAEKQLKVVTETDSTRYVAFYLLGFSQRKLGENDESFKNITYYLDRSDKNDPYRLYALVEIGYLCETMKDCPSAIKFANQAQAELTNASNDVLKEKVQLMIATVNKRCK